MGDEQFVTAQTLALRLVSIGEKVAAASKAMKALEAEERDTESALLDSLGSDVSVTYAVGKSAVTVTKKNGHRDQILISDLVIV